MSVESPVADHPGRRPVVVHVRADRSAAVGAIRRDRCGRRRRAGRRRLFRRLHDGRRLDRDGRRGATRVDPRRGVDESETPRPGQEPEGFSTMTARITETDGQTCEVCVWLADSPEERGRGLMGVTDLGDAAGMVFLFDEPVAGSFYMFQTPTPLSIAWFSPTGDHVGSADMAPCLDTPAGECPLYSPGVEYDLATRGVRGWTRRSRRRPRLPARTDRRHGGRRLPTGIGHTVSGLLREAANSVTPPRHDRLHETPSRDRHRPR